MKKAHSKPFPPKDLFSLSELADLSAEKYGDLPAMRVWRDKQYIVFTFNALRDRVHSVAKWLINEGVQPGDHVAIMGQNSPEWETTYLAIQCAGAVGIPIDRMLPPSGVRHILSDSKSRLLFADSAFLQSLKEVEAVSSLQRTISLDDIQVEDSLLFKDILTTGSKLDTKLRSKDMEELAVILYTSGTTGHSKGVMLSSHNIASDVIMAAQYYDLGVGDNWLSILPVHHSFEATAGFLFSIFQGSCITFAKSLAGPEIVASIRDTGVTCMCGVPLVFEKMQAGIFRNLKKKSPFAQLMFRTLLRTVIAGEKVGLNLGKMLFKSVRKKAGMGTIRVFLSAGGPLDPEIARFFNRMGLTLVQGYGLTETAPCTHLTPPWKLVHHSVGPPMPGIECKILNPNEDGVGEVCVKGPNVFMGYYKNEEATKATFTEDGWFRTGDLGRILKDDYLQITGRLKAMLVTAGGKNVYPEEIEFYLNRSRYIAESVVVGIPRKQGTGEEVGALIYPDYEQIDIRSESTGKQYSVEDIYRIIQEEVRKAQKNLADYKKIKEFRIFDSEFQKTTKRTIKRFLYSSDMISVENSKV